MVSRASCFSSLASLDFKHSFFNMKLALGRWEVHYGSSGTSCFCDILRLKCMSLKLYWCNKSSNISKGKDHFSWVDRYQLVMRSCMMCLSFSPDIFAPYLRTYLIPLFLWWCKSISNTMSCIGIDLATPIIVLVARFWTLSSLERFDGVAVCSHWNYILKTRSNHGLVGRL